MNIFLSKPSVIEKVQSTMMCLCTQTKPISIHNMHSKNSDIVSSDKIYSAPRQKINSRRTWKTCATWALQRTCSEASDGETCKKYSSKTAILWHTFFDVGHHRFADTMQGWRITINNGRTQQFEAVHVTHNPFDGSDSLILIICNGTLRACPIIT